jgi:DNA-binding LacI/PurR family transcriptional regulator
MREPRIHAKQHREQPSRARRHNNIVRGDSDGGVYSEIPFFHECLMGVCEASIQRDYDVLIAPVGEGNISVLKRIVSRRKVDGILLTRSLVVDYPADYLKAARIPFVTVGSSSDANMIQVIPIRLPPAKADPQVLERNTARSWR